MCFFTRALCCKVWSLKLLCQGRVGAGQEGLLEAPAPSQRLGLQAAHPGAESSPAVAVLCRPPHADPGGVSLLAAFSEAVVCVSVLLGARALIPWDRTWHVWTSLWLWLVGVVLSHGLCCSSAKLRGPVAWAV